MPITTRDFEEWSDGGSKVPAESDYWDASDSEHVAVMASRLLLEEKKRSEFYRNAVLSLDDGERTRPWCGWNPFTTPLTAPCHAVTCRAEHPYCAVHQCLADHWALTDDEFAAWCKETTTVYVSGVPLVVT